MPPLPAPLSCLSPEGELLVPEPPLGDDDAVAAYRCMLTGRRFDERCVSLQRQGRMVTLAPGVGQEAATVGAAMALDRTTDWFVPQYRELAGQLWHGYPLRLAFLWHMGHPIAFRTPEGLNMLPFQAAVAGQIPQAVGLAWGLKLQAKKAVVLVVFGEGATSEGDFHEAANFAGVVKAPVVLLCQNNRWAIATPVEAQTASATIAQKAIAYGIPGVQCDGNDVFAVYTAIKWAVDRARTGDGPTLVEALTYRLGLHTTADDPTRYLPEGEAQSWASRDPLIRLRLYLEQRGRGGELDAIDGEVTEELKRAWEEAQREPAPDAREYFEHVFADVPPRLRTQLDDLAAG
jgi:pyruvate dehydrogenase E1 component alpha subunit